MLCAAFVTALLSLALVFGLAKRRGILEVQTLLLAGVVVGALLSAMVSLVLLAGGQDTNQVLRWLKGIVLVTGTAMTAAAVGCAGIIGFLGLVAPHISRRLLGVDWRWSLPGSGLLGAGLLLLADVVGQRAVPGNELPVGIVTAILGAPFFVYLMKKGGRESWGR